jgi:hypothetical protein
MATVNEHALGLMGGDGRTERVVEIAKTLVASS